MIHICITYDYELFLGKCFCTEKEILIDTTAKLLDMYNEKNIKITLFADVCSLMRYEELQMMEFPSLAKQQLKNAVKQGHDVQLHIHPHWINARYDNGEWKYDKSQYRLESFLTDLNNPIDDIISKTKDYLVDVVGDETYECVAYRAGGYCLHPDDKIMPILYKNNIFIDSSVCVGAFRNDYPFEFNYKKIKENRNWFFDAQRGINSQEYAIGENCMVEIPIPSINGFIHKIAFKINKKSISCESSKGTFVDSDNKKRNLIYKALKKVKDFNNRVYSLNFDEYDYMSMIRILQESVIQKYDYLNEEIYIAIVGHPKMLNEEVLENTVDFINTIKQMYGEYICFDTMQDVINIKNYNKDDVK